MDLRISNKFREIKDKLVPYRYQVSINSLFEPLCWLHHHLLETKDAEVKNEFTSLLHNILIEIFMSLRQPEYEPYPLGARSYFGSNVLLQETVKCIFDLNVYSTIWLKDLSEYYCVFSQDFPEYNADNKVDYSKAEGKVYIYSQKNVGIVRSKILDHLCIYVDPEKPVLPTTNNPIDHYVYLFETALYDENKVKNRFFQNMKYKEFNELQSERTALLNLKCISREEEEIFDEEEETLTWVLKMIPSDYLYQYPLFKDNPCVYVFAYDSNKNNKDGNNPELDLFNPLRAKFKGKIIQMDEENNFLLVRIYSKKFTEKKNFALVLRPDQVSFEREKEALNIFKNHSSKELLQAIVSQKASDKITSSGTLKVKVEDYFGLDLNETQRKAVEEALQAPHLFSIHGPPGTGKTRVCAEILAQSIYLNPKARVLVTCASDEATDNLLNALKRILPPKLHHLLLHLGAKGESSLNHKIKNSGLYQEKILSLQKEISQLEQQAAEKTSERKKKEVLLEKIRIEEDKLNQGISDGQGLDRIKEIDPEKEQLIQALIKLRFGIDSLEKSKSCFREQLDKNREELKRSFLNKTPSYIFSTNNHSAVLRQYHLNFDLLVVDEITQSTEPSVLIPLNQTKKIIMAGDHHQLPPTVFLKNKNYDDEIDPEEEKKRIHSFQVLSKSIFERLYGFLHSKFIDRQYRMNPLLIDFLNQTIYAQTPLICDPLVEKYRFAYAIFHQPLIFITHDCLEIKSYVSEEFSPSRAEYHNPEEIKIIEKLVQKYLQSGVLPQDIGVISPYKAQIRELNKVLNSLNIMAKTIDSFQGQEKKIIILSLVRSNLKGTATERLGFLVDERRFNVAITRFQYELIIIGNAETLSSHEEYYDLYEDKVKPLFYKQLIEYIKEKGLFVTDTQDLDSYLKKPAKFTLPPEAQVGIKLNKELQEKMVRKLSYN
ncbi:MAG: AAA domain-containing protein [Candidatus Woesearchaeota archaeon]